jgi:nicotinate-nucleotide adenylyltransferase
MEKRRIGLFGGSFNPPTKAHLYVAEQLIERGIVDDVQFVPAYVSYHHKEYEASCSDRMSMLCLMIEESKYVRNMSVNTFEIRHKMQSSTFDFVQRFCDEGADSTNQYYFIVGGDNAKKVPNFINGGELIKAIPFIVVNRSNVCVEEIEWCSKDPHIVVNLGNDHSGCSSTKIREVVKNFGVNGAPKEFFDWCSTRVFAYILNYEIYMEKSDENS